MAPEPTQADALGHEVAQARFNRLYREQGRAILAYALRRVADPEDAADVVAETFLVAWRRFDEVPLGDEARLWLYGVARLVVSNVQRSARRRTRLAARLAESLRTEIATHAAPSGEAAEVLQAMGELGAEDRELLMLVSWEDLAPADAARVLGLSALATRSRLHRARRRLRGLMKEREAAGESSALDTEEANERA
jgi:RNA polymerase sigma factor (sigma-70 family)